MSDRIKKEVSRAMGNFSRVPSFTTNLKEEEVNYWLENYSDTVFCRGSLRQINFRRITDKYYVVTSESMFNQFTKENK